MQTTVNAKGFEDEITKLANAQSELALRVRDCLEGYGIPYGWYCDWLNEFCLWDGNQMNRLVELFKEAHPEAEAEDRKEN